VADVNEHLAILIVVVTVVDLETSNIKGEPTYAIADYYLCGKYRDRITHMVSDAALGISTAGLLVSVCAMMNV
jgi:hypothetical protein